MSIADSITSPSASSSSSPSSSSSSPPSSSAAREMRENFERGVLAKGQDAAFPLALRGHSPPEEPHNKFSAAAVYPNAKHHRHRKSLVTSPSSPPTPPHPPPLPPPPPPPPPSLPPTSVRRFARERRTAPNPNQINEREKKGQRRRRGRRKVLDVNVVSSRRHVMVEVNDKVVILNIKHSSFFFLYIFQQKSTIVQLFSTFSSILSEYVSAIYRKTYSLYFVFIFFFFLFIHFYLFTLFWWYYVTVSNIFLQK